MVADEREGKVVYVPEAAAIHTLGNWQDKPNQCNPQLAANHQE